MEKEIQIININPSDVAKEYKEKLKDPNLSLIKRKTYETYLKNYELRNMNMEEKQDAILKENLKKQQKKKTLTPKKIMITAAFTTLVATTTFTGFKIYKHYERLNILNNYNKQYISYQIEYGDTLSNIASKYYSQYPEDVKKHLELNQLIEEIKQVNHLTDENKIQAGKSIIIPSKYENRIQTEEKHMK